MLQLFSICRLVRIRVAEFLFIDYFPITFCQGGTSGTPAMKLEKKQMNMLNMLIRFFKFHSGLRSRQIVLEPH